jgi:hypothetical protein
MHNQMTNAISKDVAVLGNFISIYCKGKHRDRITSLVNAPGKLGVHVNSLSLELCDECKALLLYAASKRLICPYDPKPACKDCATHCYAEPHRSRIREVMRYSGMRMILRGSISYIKKFL